MVETATELREESVPVCSNCKQTYDRYVPVLIGESADEAGWIDSIQCIGCAESTLGVVVSEEDAVPYEDLGEGKFEQWDFPRDHITTDSVSAAGNMAFIASFLVAPFVAVALLIELNISIVWMVAVSASTGVMLFILHLLVGVATLE